MLFSTFAFAIFFPLVLLIHRILRPGNPRKLFLLLASYYFYGSWSWRFLGLIATSSLIDYVVGAKIYHAKNSALRRLWLTISLAANLGILGFFKYYNFFAASLMEMGEKLGVEFSFSTLNIVLPVGISFYTFQTLSYSIDIYRRRLKPCSSLLDFSLFVAFFPQLVAGPIVRAAEFLPQLKTPARRTPSQFLEGLDRFLIGLFKKIMIADIAAMVVDPVFSDFSQFSGPVCFAAAIAFSIQIYFDFSGYSDMAIGLAAMLGYQLPQNFRLPYLSASMTDFWRRWHISLSSWFRDYLYIPLGGNRHGAVKTYRNLVLTFLLTGLWHGANWTFIAFGAWNGVLLLIERLLRRPANSPASFILLRRMLGHGYSLLAIVIAFAIFRAPSIAAFGELAQRIVNSASGQDAWFSPLRFNYLVGITLLYHFLSTCSVRERSIRLLGAWFWRPFFYTLIVVTMLAYAPLGERAFIYFAF